MPSGAVILAMGGFAGECEMTVGVAFGSGTKTASPRMSIPVCRRPLAAGAGEPLQSLLVLGDEKDRLVQIPRDLRVRDTRGSVRRSSGGPCRTSEIRGRSAVARRTKYASAPFYPIRSSDSVAATASNAAVMEMRIMGRLRSS
jgi:hypothetical protein